MQLDATATLGYGGGFLGESEQLIATELVRPSHIWHQALLRLVSKAPRVHSGQL